MTANAKKCLIFGTTPTRGEALKRTVLLQVEIYRQTVPTQAIHGARARRTARLRAGECSARHGL